MNFWLLKSEPNAYSWQDLEKDNTTNWDGVRNYQARNFMKQMQLNDLAFFYHSVIEKQIIGIVKIVKSFYEDPVDNKWGIVDVELYKKLNNPVSLEQIKKEPKLQNMLLIKQSRLSVSPVEKKDFLFICKNSNTELYIS